MSNNGNNKRRNGLGLLCTLLILGTLCVAASVVIELGRVQLARRQLRTTCEAAALVAAELLAANPEAARQAAIDTAAANFADGSRVVLEPGDVQFIRYNAKTRRHTVLEGGQLDQVNAVRVAARRSDDNVLRRSIARITACPNRDISAAAIAMAPRQYGLVGLDFIKIDGRASAGPLKNNPRGAMATNGAITLSGASIVNGDAHPGVGRQVVGAEHVNGAIVPLTARLSYPAADPGNAIKQNSNDRINWLLSSEQLLLGRQQKASIPGGTYYVSGLTIGAGSELRFTGPTTLYVAGNIDLQPHAVLHPVHAGQLKVIVIGRGAISFLGNTTLRADLYAPQADLNLQGSGEIIGSVIARSVTLGGNVAVHYDIDARSGVKLVN